MNRILFAAGRRARIQYRYREGKWIPASGVSLIKKDGHLWRIHPDDEHLQYGPVSSELRGAAATGRALGLISEPGKMASIALRSEAWDCIYADELHRSLFLLLMAESLADEGF